MDADLHPGAAASLAEIGAALGGRGLPVRTSPALRCRRTALAIGPDPLPDDRLLELDFGAWEGTAWDAVPRDALDAWAADPMGFAAPGGETGSELVARVTSFHRELRDEGQDCVVVSHGGPLRVLISLLRGEPASLLNAPPAQGSITWIAQAP